MSLLTIARIFSEAQKLSQLEEIKVQGWVKSIRQSKNISFITLNDGSCLQNLQVVCPSHLTEEIKNANFGSCLRAKGKLILTLDRAQKIELRAQKIEFVNPAAADYPLQKQAIPLEVVRNYPHLRAKTNYFLAIFKLRSQVSWTIHQFFQQAGFFYIHTPLITANDTEGAGELFTVTTRQDKQYEKDFFRKQGKLTVSGQLQAEALAQGLGKVYTFSPCFRAENSHTTRHLAEFWMIEPEMTFADLDDLLNLAENLLKYVIQKAIENNLPELEYLEKYHQKELIGKLKKISKLAFPRLNYAECLKILEKNKKNFVYNEIKWGMDLQSEHEKYLCQHFNNSPVFVVNYPTELKAFYMKNNLDQKTVVCFDLLFPEIGELIGGSVRENNYQTLIKKAQKISLDVDNFAWYFDLRNFGYAPSGGFGLGLERLLMFLTGTENIRDVIPFPRYPQHLEY
ncbi:MAG: asparaginyl-tRNA synthetase [Mycoplasmataceae bacterium CE_OT135]|nr:MAG: asparaginyl-tRNA synthetase [Mycoplasmataceae bacterium CE_OT135]